MGYLIKEETEKLMRDQIAILDERERNEFVRLGHAELAKQLFPDPEGKERDA